MKEKMLIIKRSGKKEQFNPNKIKNAIKAAFNSVGYTVDDDVYNELVNSVKVWNEMTIEDIQDQVIETEFDCSEHNVNESLGRWIRNCISYSFNNHYQPVKIACSTPIDAYKSLFEKENDDYYIGLNGNTSMYQIYNAFTQVITDGMKKDPFNIFEKTLLVKDILDI